MTNDEKQYMAKEDLVVLLLEIAARVVTGDCRGGTITFNGFFTEHEDGSRFDVQSAFRTGNNDSQGSIQTVGT